MSVTQPCCMFLWLKPNIACLIGLFFYIVCRNRALLYNILLVAKVGLVTIFMLFFSFSFVFLYSKHNTDKRKTVW